MLPVIDMKIGESFYFKGENERHKIWNFAFLYSEASQNFEFRMKIVSGKMPCRRFKIWRVKKTRFLGLNPMKRRRIK